MHCSFKQMKCLNPQDFIVDMVLCRFQGESTSRLVMNAEIQEDQKASEGVWAGSRRG